MATHRRGRCYSTSVSRLRKIAAWRSPCASSRVTEDRWCTRGCRIAVAVRFIWSRCAFTSRLDFLPMHQRDSSSMVTNHGVLHIRLPSAATRIDATYLSRIAKLNHQSEVERPQDAPEGATSEQFTIVESESRSRRFLAGFVGSAHQLTTVTVPDAESGDGAGVTR